MNVPAKLTQLTGKAQTLLSKHSPEIWLGAGIVAIIGGTIWACKASRELDDILEEGRDEKETIDINYEEDYDILHDGDEDPDPANVAALDKQHKKDLMVCNIQTAGDVVRAYAPAVILIGGGIGMIIQGHRILCKRNATLLAAYTALDQSFTTYRDRVKERYGEEVEREIYTGVSKAKVTTSEVGEDGKKHKVTEEVPVIGQGANPYSMLFEEGATDEWTKSPSFNHTFLTCQQNSANDYLRRHGHMFLNEVYKMLGFDPTPTGAICGWVMPKDGEVADDYIDFGMVEDRDENGNTRVLLNFNCQGVMYDKI